MVNVPRRRPVVRVRLLLAGLLVGLLVALLLAWLLGSRPAQAQPNPYGASSARTAVVVHADGSYTATLTQRQELVRPYDVVFGGAVHDGFRLPDSGDGFPPYLRATYEVVSATLDGVAVPVTAEVDRHRVAIRVERDGLEAGDHEAVLVYRVRGAALPQRDGLRAFVRPLVSDRDGGGVDISTDIPGAEVTRTTCVVFAPDEVSCGAVGSDAPPTDVVATVRAADLSLAAPQLDRA